MARPMGAQQGQAPGMMRYCAVLALLGVLLCSACTAVGGAAIGAGALTVYNTLSTAQADADTVNSGLKVGEDLICGTWGLYWRGTVPDDLTGWREDVAIFCSGDPAIGSTPEATLIDLWKKVQAIRAAKLKPPAA